MTRFLEKYFEEILLSILFFAMVAVSVWLRDNTEFDHWARETAGGVLGALLLRMKGGMPASTQQNTISSSTVNQPVAAVEPPKEKP